MSLIWLAASFAVLILYEKDKIQKEIGNEKEKKPQTKTNYSHVNIPIKAIDHVALDSIILISWSRT